MVMDRRRCDLCEDNFYCRDIDCMSVDNYDSVVRRVLQIRICHHEIHLPTWMVHNGKFLLQTSDTTCRVVLSINH